MVPGNMSAESSVSWFHKKLIFQKYLSKFKHFDWVMAKLVLILANQISKIWEISTLQNQLTDDSALSILRAEK